MIKWILELALGGLTAVIKPVFEFLNKRVDAKLQMHISDNATIATVGSALVNAQTEADRSNAQIRLAEGKWSPWVIVTIAGFMLPFAWHTWQVVLDSSAWHIVLGNYYLPTLSFHKVGSWNVAKLPGMWETTEHAVIQSLFIGASAGVGAIMIIKAMRGK